MAMTTGRGRQSRWARALPATAAMAMVAAGAFAIALATDSIPMLGDVRAWRNARTLVDECTTSTGSDCIDGRMLAETKARMESAQVFRSLSRQRPLVAMLATNGIRHGLYVVLREQPEQLLYLRASDMGGEKAMVTFLDAHGIQYVASQRNANR